MTYLQSVKAAGLQHVAVLILTTVSVTLFMARLRETSVSPELDPSWVAVLQYAHSHDLHMGQDIVFTYGPLGYLLSGLHGGGDPLQRLAFELPFVALNILGIVILAQRLPSGWGTCMLLIIAFGAIHLGSVREALVPLGFLCWGLLCFAGPTRPLGLPSLGVGMLAGVAGMIKFSWLVAGSFTVVAALLAFAISRRWRSMLLLATVFPLALAVAWMLHSRTLGSLVNYVAVSAAITSGYSSAMGVPCSSMKLLLGVGAVCCVAITVVLTRPEPLGDSSIRNRLKLVVMSVWLAGLAFVSWKHGFVRADLHVMFLYIFACIAPFAVLSLPAASPSLDTMRKRCALLAVMFTSIGSLTTLKASFVTAPYIAVLHVWDNLRCLADVRSHCDSINASWKSACQQMELRDVSALVGSDSIDVFGYRQAYAIANGWNYTPRPIFQSYCAYNRELCELNRDFYRSSLAPEWVLFALEPIDRRLPALEDSKCLAEILRNYTMVLDKSSLILLKRGKRVASKASLLCSGTTMVGKAVDVSMYVEHDLWIEATVARHTAVTVHSAVLRAPGLQIRMQVEKDGVASEARTDIIYTTPISMLETGFIGSPLLEDNADVKDYLAGRATKRLRSFTFEPTHGTSPLTNAGIQYKIYSMEAANSTLGGKL